MKILFLSFFVAYIFFFPYNAGAQNDNRDLSYYKHCDTLSKAQFDKMVRMNLREMRSEKSFSVGEIIKIVKVFMTFSLHKEYAKKRFIKNFKSIYGKEYLGKACVMLGSCTALRGVVMYSEKYELYLSRTADPMHCYNYYTIR